LREIGKKKDFSIPFKKRARKALKNQKVLKTSTASRREMRRTDR